MLDALLRSFLPKKANRTSPNKFSMAGPSLDCGRGRESRVELRGRVQALNCKQAASPITTVCLLATPLCTFLPKKVNKAVSIGVSRLVMPTYFGDKNPAHCARRLGSRRANVQDRGRRQLCIRAALVAGRHRIVAASHANPNCFRSPIASRQVGG